MKTLVNEYHKTRNFIHKILKEVAVIDFEVPKGAFYYYMDISKTGIDSSKFVDKLMHDTGVVLTPGKDFDKSHGEKTVRLSFSSKSEIVLEAVELLYKWLRKNY